MVIMIVLGKLKALIFNKLLVCFFLIGFMFNSGFAQEMSKKELKEKEQVEKGKETLELIESKTFTFTARTAIANGGRTIDLTNNPNFIKFSHDMVESEMPFFGQSTGAGHYASNDAGLNFKGKPKKFTIDKAKKKYKVRVDVKDSKDSYRLNLSTSLEGNSTITITSNRKSVMTYHGRISKE